MSEKLKKVSKVTISSAAAIAAGMLTTGKANAAPEHPISHDKVEMTQPDHRVSMEDIEYWEQEKLDNGQDLNFYRGTVEIVRPNGEKVFILNPIPAYRYGTDDTNQEKFALNHPRSKFWAIGYIVPGVEPGQNKGGPTQIRMLPFNNNGNNIRFHGEPHQDAAVSGVPEVDAVRFNKDSIGNPDLSNPLGVSGKTLTEGYKGPVLEIGKMFAPPSQPPAES